MIVFIGLQQELLRNLFKLLKKMIVTIRVVAITQLSNNCSLQYRTKGKLQSKLAENSRIRKQIQDDGGKESLIRLAKSA